MFPIRFSCPREGIRQGPVVPFPYNEDFDGDKTVQVAVQRLRIAVCPLTPESVGFRVNPEQRVTLPLPSLQGSPKDFAFELELPSGLYQRLAPSGLLRDLMCLSPARLDREKKILLPLGEATELGRNHARLVGASSSNRMARSACKRSLPSDSRSCSIDTPAMLWRRYPARGCGRRALRPGTTCCKLGARGEWPRLRRQRSHSRHGRCALR